MLENINTLCWCYHKQTIFQEKSYCNKSHHSEKVVQVYISRMKYFVVRCV